MTSSSFKKSGLIFAERLFCDLGRVLVTVAECMVMDCHRDGTKEMQRSGICREVAVSGSSTVLIRVKRMLHVLS